VSGQAFRTYRQCDQATADEMQQNSEDTIARGYRKDKARSAEYDILMGGSVDQRA